MTIYKRDGVELWVSKNRILAMTNPDNIPKDFEIPCCLPNGDKITAVSTAFCRGLFSKVSLPAEVSDIPEKAFYNAFIGELVWPAACTKIPRECFYRGHVKKITNLSGVKEVGVKAFADSEIEEIVWPDECHEIPEKCFSACSSLKHVSNMYHVESIKPFAFLDCLNIDKIDLTASLSCSIARSAFVGINEAKIFMPYYAVANS